MSPPPAVAVSGISGYIGAQIALDLLTRGYTVHGTVRRNTPEKLSHLSSRPDLKGTLKVFEADLNVPASFDAAVRGCRCAIHVASPYFLNARDPQRDLVDPAVRGTRSFLASCKAAAVEKVVLTSSVAAIADAGVPGKVFDEADWNTASSLTRLPYYFSKAQAERAAWDFVDGESPPFKLVVINPFVVLGPSLIKAKNESMGVLESTATGAFGGIVDLDFQIVDVRDVSEAHIRAMESDSAEGRYVCCSDRLMPHRELAQVAADVGFKPAMRDLTGKFMSFFVKTVSYIVPGGDAGVFTRNHLGNPIVASNAKIVKDLGMTFRDPAQTVKETYEDMIKQGHVKLPQS